MFKKWIKGYFFSYLVVNVRCYLVIILNNLYIKKKNCGNFGSIKGDS